MANQDKSKSLGTSPNPAEENRRHLAELLPEAFSEGRLDIQALKRSLGEDVVIEGGERYRLEWAGKSAAFKVLQTPSTATLRPQRDKSVNFDTAQHVFIEGENLEVLKVLQKAYFGKIKLIYIDPPYNTGNDSFIYPDRFQESKEEYLKRINELSDDGTLMREGFFRKNSRESGHFHSNWLSMMLPRLYIARNLLREDGVIFVSIDDNETHTLRSLMDEVYGSENYLCCFVRKRRMPTGLRETPISPDHEYVIGYCRDISNVRLFGRNLIESDYPFSDAMGKFRSTDLTVGMTKEMRPNQHYELKNPKTNKGYWPAEQRVWRFERSTMQAHVEAANIIWPDDYPDSNMSRPRFKTRFSAERTAPISTWIAPNSEDVGVDPTTYLVAGMNQEATKELRDIFGSQLLEYPKPVSLISELIRCSTESGDVVLDFFAGSCTTAQAAIEIPGGRRSICVQLPEPVDRNSEAAGAGFKTIADIGRARVAKVIERVRSQSDLATAPAKGLGLKSLLLSPSNFRQWRGDSIETAAQLAEQMTMFVKSEKDGADVDAMLYELLLRFGQELTTPVETLKVQGQRVFAVRNRKMLFVLERFAEPMLDPLLEFKPDKIIALDSVFAGSDELKTNFALHCRDVGIAFTCV